MAFLIWLLGLVMMAAAVAITYQFFKKVTWPYNRFNFEHTNEHGVLVFETYDDKLKYDIYKAKTQTIEKLVSIPILLLFTPGCMMVTYGIVKFIGR